MYAVIETGGKQYRVELGNEIEVERLDVEPGSSIDLERVLLVADGETTSIGRPLVDGARVTADVLRQDRADKIVVFKYKPKARRRVKHGHRQDLTILRIADIALGDRSAAREAQAAATEQEAARAAAAEAAAQKAEADKALAAKLESKDAAPEAPTKSRPGIRRVRAGAAPKPAAKAEDKKAAPGRKPASRTQAGESGATKSPRRRTPKKDE